MNHVAELRAAMIDLDARYDAGDITHDERWHAYGPLNDEYRALTGSYYVSGRYAVESMGLSVHHDRAYLHQR